MEATLQINDIAFGGAGVGHLPDGRVCFVHGTLPGERVVVETINEKKSYVEAALVRLIEASPRRIPPRCPVFGICGGCAYQHATYDLQLEIKTAQVADILRRIGGFTGTEVRPTLPSPKEWEYRNRISVHVADGQVGFHGRKSREIVPVSHCPIASPDVNAHLASLARKPPRSRNRFTLRAGTATPGFSQVNDSAAATLLDVVGRMLTGDATELIDAYCGSGFFAKSQREAFAKITGIEWSEPAIEHARRDAGPNETYVRGAVEHCLDKVLAESDPAATALIVDPPAEGLPNDVVEAIRARPPAKFVYVSCHPATLARDLKKLSGLYKIDHVQPVDMFPQTAEIEVAASCRPA